MLSSPCSSSSADDRSGPSAVGPDKPLEGLLKDALANMGRGPLREELVKSEWAKAAGAKAARHSAPASFKRSRLVVNVDGSSWLYELTLKKKDILKKLGGKLCGKSVKEIQFRVGEIK